ncbi:Thioredoxin H2-1 [Porphyridium purpureum]|uniref:Thioredoxin H2-1 n=1 Tax=Porphyridium purpureum TaxID=35688 RepID=A0A5J4YP33_PORPP|nr:Thioredoxin H2-1 [Porphyridium purpureum]|eukprot:POR5213..scf222_8
MTKFTEAVDRLAAVEHGVHAASAEWKGRPAGPANAVDAMAQCEAWNLEMKEHVEAVVFPAEIKAQQGLKDPSSRMYGEAMSKRILDTAQKARTVRAELDELRALVENTAKEVMEAKQRREEHEREMERLEQETRAMKLEQQRLEEETQKRRDAEEAAARAQAEELAKKERIERFRQRRAEKKLAEEEAKKKGTGRALGKANVPAAPPSTSKSGAADSPVRNDASKPAETAEDAPAAIQTARSVQPPPAEKAPEGPEGIITVKSADGKSFQVSVRLSESVQSLRQKIAGLCKVSDASNVRILYRGTLLKRDDSSLRDVGIEFGSAVHVVVKNRDSVPALTQSTDPGTAAAAAVGAAPRVAGSGGSVDADATASSAPGPASSATTPSPAQSGSNMTGEAAGPPSGSVLEITSGAQGLNEVLARSGATRLVICDYSAPWCGPCRAIAPIYSQMASANPHVSFVSVNSEASPANAQLARTAGVRGYPTFHAYRNFHKLGELVGANPQQLQHFIEQHAHSSTDQPAVVQAPSVHPSSSVPAPVSASAPGSSSLPQSPGASVSMTQRVMAALRMLKAACATPSEFQVAAETLITFVRNVETNPGEPKFRRIKLSNAAFQRRLAHRAGGIECVRAFGFEESLDPETNERVLVMPEASARNPELGTVRRQLEAAVAAAAPAGHAGTGAPTAPGMGSSNSSFGGTFPAMPSSTPPGMPQPPPAAMGALMGDPSFRNLANELMSDPSAMSEVMQAQQAMQSGDIGAMQRLQASPTFARLATAMAGNPAFAQAMMSGGLPGAGGFGAPFQPSPPVQRSQVPAAGSPPLQVPQEPQQRTLSPEEEEEAELQRAIQLSLEEEQTNRVARGGDQNSSGGTEGN